MSRPFLPRWLQRWCWGVVIVLGLCAISLLAVNLPDALAYRRALRRAQNLSTAELKRIAAFCSNPDNLGKYQRASGQAIPPELSWLRPVRVSIYPGSSQITLFDRTYPFYLHGAHFFDVDLSVWLNISCHADNQIIACGSSSASAPKSRTLWSRDPKLTGRLHPLDRIVTLTQAEMHSVRQWIVRPTELLIENRPDPSGRSEAVANRVALNPSDISRITSAINEIGPSVRGHAFDSGAMDGVQLHICFAADGHDGGPCTGDDILLSNAWTDEMRPLIGVINELAGPDAKIVFPKVVEEMDALMARNSPDAYPITVTSLATYNERYYRRPLPWWCLWPRFVNR